MCAGECNFHFDKRFDFQRLSCDVSSSASCNPLALAGLVRWHLAPAFQSGNKSKRFESQQL